ncbi:hypothetical protein HYZ99_00480 [Candidatus Peregrinibacteria bacterium]|nr:hypothetical protein [Candidatus Peregrinibacteria bacterium]
MSINTLKAPALVTPQTYGELEEFLNLSGNHPARYTHSDDPGFETFQDDERFLLHLRTMNEDPSSPLPLAAKQGAEAMIQYLEPAKPLSPKGIGRSISQLRAKMTGGVPTLLGRN